MMSAPTLLLSFELKLSFAQWNEELVNVLIGHIGDCGWIPSRTLVLVHQRSTDPYDDIRREIEHAMDRSGTHGLEPRRGETEHFMTGTHATARTRTTCDLGHGARSRVLTCVSKCAGVERM